MPTKPIPTTGVPQGAVPELLLESGPDHAGDDGVVRGIDAVEARRGKHGLVDSHLHALADLAESQNVVFGICKVNYVATQLISRTANLAPYDVRGIGVP